MKFRADKFNEPEDYQYYEAEDDIEEFDDYDIEQEYDKPVKKPKRLWKFLFRFVAFCFLVVAINLGVLLFSGKLWFNQPDKNQYPVRGAFVDSDMGRINWNTFSGQNISLAYIKATKGIAYKDDNFESYWAESKGCELMTGAYHQFAPTKSGRKQAEYFCNTVGKSIKGRLIPAVEVKLYGIYAVLPPDVEDVTKNLMEFCDYIKSRYGIYPIIITDKRCYEKYLSEFDVFRFIMKSYFDDVKNGLPSDFWCYNPRVRVNGYENEKEYFSMFVYYKNIDVDTFRKEFVC